MLIDKTSSVSFRLACPESAMSCPQLDWAISELRARFGDRGLILSDNADDDIDRPGLVLALGPSTEIARQGADTGIEIPEHDEAFAIFRIPSKPQDKLYIYGADIRGLVYAITELADRLRYSASIEDALEFPTALVETPSAKVRSISRCFQSEVEDLSWFRDKDGWEDYLTQLVTHRFNRITLTFGMQYNYPYGNEFLSDVYLHFAYPFLIDLPTHHVAVSNFTDAERRLNLRALKFIAREAARRGLEFQLALWTQNYDFDDCPDARHQITGLGPENIARYCRDALETLLAEVPEISGLTLRVHVECGIAEGNYTFWRTYFEAIETAGREVRIDLHAKGIDQALIDIALATGMPVTISPKYTLEHMGLPYHQASIRLLEHATEASSGNDRTTLYSGRDAERFDTQWKFSEGVRKFMRYSYGDLLRDDRPYDVVFRIWPGTQRILIWGDPILAAGFGRNSTFCGAHGIELCEPLSFKGRMGSGQRGSRTGYMPGVQVHARDWEKFAYTYRVWGRSLYDPETDPDAFRRFLNASFGRAGAHCGAALGSASRILPLIAHAHTPTASNNSYWPEIYENMSIVHEAPALPYGYELFRPARFGTVGSADPQIFMAPAEFAACLHDGEAVRRISPLTWANWLEKHANEAIAEIELACHAAGGEYAELQLVAVDIRIMAAIGRFFAEKVRAAILWEYYLLSGAALAADHAEARYRAARDCWAEASLVSRDVYVPDITYGPHTWLRGRWDDRLPAIDRDIEDLRSMKEMGARTAHTANALEASQVEQVLNWSSPQIHGCVHQPPSGFDRGAALDLACVPSGASRTDVYLHYRHALQTETWQVTTMKWMDGAYRASIPGSFTESPYAILYYFEIGSGGSSSFYPGLSEDVSGSPYIQLDRNLTGQKK